MVRFDNGLAPAIVQDGGRDDTVPRSNLKQWAYTANAAQEPNANDVTRTPPVTATSKGQHLVQVLTRGCGTNHPVDSSRTPTTPTGAVQPPRPHRA